MKDKPWVCANMVSIGLKMNRRTAYDVLAGLAITNMINDDGLKSMSFKEGQCRSTRIFSNKN